MVSNNEDQLLVVGIQDTMLRISVLDENEHASSIATRLASRNDELPIKNDVSKPSSVSGTLLPGSGTSEGEFPSDDGHAFANEEENSPALPAATVANSRFESAAHSSASPNVIDNAAVHKVNSMSSTSAVEPPSGDSRAETLGTTASPQPSTTTNSEQDSSGDGVLAKIDSKHIKIYGALQDRLVKLQVLSKSSV